MNIGLIYLASGLSRRFGGNKLLVPFRGRPLFTYGLGHLQEAADLLTLGAGKQGTSSEEQPRSVAGGCHPLTPTICVVTMYAPIQEYCRERQILCVDNPMADEGMAASIRCGVAQLSQADGWAFFTADQPFLRPQTIADFLWGFAQSGKSIGVVTAGARRGSPAVFRQSRRSDLLALHGDTGGRSLFQQYAEDIWTYDVPREELVDMDTPDVLARYV